MGEKCPMIFWRPFEVVELKGRSCLNFKILTSKLFPEKEKNCLILFRVIWQFQVIVFTKAHEGERVISPSGFHYLWFATKCTFDPFRPFISNPRNVRFVSNLEGENCTGDLSRKDKLLFYLGSLEFFFSSSFLFICIPLRKYHDGCAIMLYV